MALPSGVFDAAGPSIVPVTRVATCHIGHMRDTHRLLDPLDILRVPRLNPVEQVGKLEQSTCRLAIARCIGQPRRRPIATKSTGSDAQVPNRMTRGPYRKSARASVKSKFSLA